MPRSSVDRAHSHEIFPAARHGDLPQAEPALFLQRRLDDHIALRGELIFRVDVIRCLEIIIG